MIGTRNIKPGRPVFTTDVMRTIAPHLCTSTQNARGNVFYGWYYVTPSSIEYITAVLRLVAAYTDEADDVWIETPDGDTAYVTLYVGEDTRMMVRLFYPTYKELGD